MDQRFRLHITVIPEHDGLFIVHTDADVERKHAQLPVFETAFMRRQAGKTAAARFPFFLTSVLEEMEG
jgi:hypothetical protein